MNKQLKHYVKRLIKTLTLEDAELHLETLRRKKGDEMADVISKYFFEEINKMILGILGAVA